MFKHVYSRIELVLRRKLSYLMTYLKYIYILSFFVLSIGKSQAQKKDKIKYKADELENFREDGVKFKKLTGNVVFTQKSTVINCDSAYFYSKENRMEAFGRVRIKDGDSITITSNLLTYIGDESKAFLRENVVYTNLKETLYTDFLNYDVDEKIAHYFNKGKLVDKDNTLTSEIGYYYSNTDYAEFYKNVFLKSQEYDLYTDTLEYFTESKTGISRGPTRIVTDDSVTVNSEGGKFKTARKLTEFLGGNIESEDYIIIGDELYFDDQEEVYTAIGHVKLKAKEDDIIIYGNKAIYDKKSGVSKVFGFPLMKKLMKKDTFYLAADTLVAIENEDESKERILAYENVKIFKSNLQGIADSLAYFQADSMISLYDDPVLWNQDSQIESDSIDILLANEQIDGMSLRKNSFLISKDTLGQYNQIKGRDMVAKFMDDYIQTVDVNGNGHSLYFVLENDSLLLGMNNIYCSNMRIRFDENILESISFYKSPDAKFIPPQKLTESDQVLEGFSWRIIERPKLEEVATYFSRNSDIKSVSKRQQSPVLEKPKQPLNRY